MSVSTSSDVIHDKGITESGQEALIVSDHAGARRCRLLRLSTEAGKVIVSFTVLNSLRCSAISYDHGPTPHSVHLMS